MVIDLNYLIEKLRLRLIENLPGLESQFLMAPAGRRELYADSKDTDAKESAVLILIYPEYERIFLPLMKRNEYPGVHSGQVSLPGGKKENIDTNLIATALRESKEELGIVPDDVDILGELTELYIPVSNFRVLPILGCYNSKPLFIPNPLEVQELIEMPIELLIKSDVRKYKKMELRGGNEVDVPYFDLNGHVVWGATAMILSEFSQVLAESLDL